jgi:NAD(P)-dependent dehydrogenase (short-subunit alcohol dehydrogenase family)
MKQSATIRFSQRFLKPIDSTMSSPNATASAFRIDGKVCVITGGASGLGLASAIALLDAGASGVTLVDLNPSSLQSVLSGPLKAYEGRVDTYSGDIGEESVNEGMIAQATQKWGKAPEVAVLCAGISQSHQVPLCEMGEEVWDKVMKVNLKGCEFILLFE